MANYHWGDMDEISRSAAPCHFDPDSQLWEPHSTHVCFVVDPFGDKFKFCWDRGLFSKQKLQQKKHPKHGNPIQRLVGGIPTPLKNMKVSWDDHSQYMESHKSHVPNHQPVYFIFNGYKKESEHQIDDLDDSGAPHDLVNLPTGWCPPVISWFTNPINYSYIYHKP